MPYKNIVFVKLEKRLLNDHRWFGMSDKAQLLYIKLILGAAETYNKLPSDWLLLRRQLRCEWKPNVFQKALDEIQNNFPKFKKNGKFYYFEEFENKTNYIRESLGSAQVLPKVGVDKEKEEDIEKEKDIEKLTTYWDSALTTPKLLEKELIEELFNKFGFKKTKNIIRQFAEGSFRSTKTMREALNDDGTIKPKTDKKQEGITVDKVG